MEKCDVINRYIDESFQLCRVDLQGYERHGSPKPLHIRKFACCLDKYKPKGLNKMISHSSKFHMHISTVRTCTVFDNFLPDTRAYVFIHLSFRDCEALSKISNGMMRVYQESIK